MGGPREPAGMARIERVTPYTLEPQLVLFRRRLRRGMDLARMPVASDLARASGVTEKAVMSYLRGEHLPQAVQLVRISRALGVSCDWLLGFEAPALSGRPPGTPGPGRPRPATRPVAGGAGCREGAEEGTGGLPWGQAREGGA